MAESSTPLHLKVFNSKVELSTQDSSILKAAKSQLKISYRDPRKPSEFLSIYLGRGDFFPSGYLEQFAKRLHRKGIPFTVEDLRSDPVRSARFKFKLPFELKPHQLEAIQSTEANDRGIISSPTASGKSAVIGGIINEKKTISLIVTINTTVRDELNRSFKEWFGSSASTTTVPTKPWAPGLNEKPPEQDCEDEVETESEAVSDETPSFDFLFKKKAPKEKRKPYEVFKERQLKSIKKQIETGSWFKPITVICYHSLSQLPPEYLDQVGLIIVDECQTASIEAIRNAIFRAENARCCYGLSATPWRDQPQLFRLMQSAIGSEIIYDYPMHLAIEEQVVAKPSLNMILSPLPEKWLRSTKDPRKIIDDGIIRNKDRNRYVVKKAIDLFEDGGRVLIALEETGHFEGKMVEVGRKNVGVDEDGNPIEKRILEREKDVSYSLKVLFEERGVKVHYISGNDSSAEKNRKIKALNESNEPFILVGTLAIGVGTDLPRINKVFIASGGKSSIRFMQWIGRGMRTAGEIGKTLEVFMFMDAWNARAKSWSAARMRIFAKQYPGCKIFA